MLSRFSVAGLVCLVLATGLFGADPVKPKRLLLVTHSGGFIHDSVGEIGRAHV